MRIGLISDTHIPLNATELPSQLQSIFAGVDLILHAGDIYLSSVLDELEQIAPVLAAYGDGDERMRLRIKDDSRIKFCHVLEIDCLHIGLIHSLRLHDSPERLFGRHVDVAVCGHSHEEKIQNWQGVIIINPGSATLPYHQMNTPGTVAILEINGDKAEVRIVQIRE